MNTANRQEIQEKIEAGEARNRARGEGTFMEKTGEKAVEAKDRFTEFAKEHPVALVAGGLALGIAISALFPRSPTRRAGAKVGARTAAIGTLAAELAMNYAQRAFETASEAGHAGAERLEDLGDAASDRAQRLRRDAGYFAASTGDTARQFSRDTRKKVRRALS